MQVVAGGGLMRQPLGRNGPDLSGRRSGVPIRAASRGATLTSTPGGLRLSLPRAGLGEARSAVRFFPWFLGADRARG